MNFQQLDRFMDDMPKRGIPGCEVILSHQGKEVYRKAVGVESLVSHKPVSSKTLWWIYSATKICTCVAAMQLVEKGQIDLEDPVSKYLPEYAELSVLTQDGIKTCQNVMKIIHLFTMTGGLDYDLEEDARKEAMLKGLDTRSVVKSFTHKPLCSEPGTHYRYSLCHDVLGAVVCSVSGLSLQDYMKKYIWEPLGMADIGFVPNREQNCRIADLYLYHNTLHKVFPHKGKYPLDNQNYESGGGGLFTCCSEYMKLLTALSLGGISPNGNRILKEDTVKMLEVNRLPECCREDLWTTRLYGYGWGLCGRVHMDPVLSLSRSSVGEFGWDGAAGAYALVDRKKEIALFFGTHVQGCSYAYHWLHPKLRDFCIESIED